MSRIRIYEIVQLTFLIIFRYENNGFIDDNNIRSYIDLTLFRYTSSMRNKKVTINYLSFLELENFLKYKVIFSLSSI